MVIRDCYFRVAGWSNPRYAVIKDNILMMEVALENCRHCATCSSRVRMVESRLRGTGANWRWESAGNGLYLVVELPEDVGRVDNYLTQLFGVPIRQTG